MNGRSSTTVNDLFENAQDQGNISAEAVKTIQLFDAGADIQAALGCDVNDVQASEVILVTIMIDDSQSIRASGNSQTMRDGHNLILKALEESKQDDSIQIHCCYLNGTILYPYGPLSSAVKMDSHNYDPRQGTPLYDNSIILLAKVLAKSQEFMDNGIPVRTVTAIITDGSDQHSVKAQDRPDMVKIVADSMLQLENHIICGVGIQDDYCTDFEDIFQQMGIDKEWILTPGNSESEIRKAFDFVSKSAVSVSQAATGASFSKIALGGFGSVSK